jgi:Na+/melibiose symporter-like transporter
VDRSFHEEDATSHSSHRSSRRVGGLLWRREFRLLWIGETTSNVGNAISQVAMPLVAVVTLHANTFTVGLLKAAAWFPWLAIGLLAGAWVDRWSRRATMLVCDLVSLLLLISVPVAAWFGVLGMGQLLVVAVLTGAAAVFFSTAYIVYLPAVVGRDDLAEGNAKLQGSESAALVVGPALGGGLAQAFGAVPGLLADAVSFGVSAVCLIRMRVRESVTDGTASAGGRRSLHREIADGLRFVAQDPYLRVVGVFAAAANLAANMWEAIVVVFLIRTVGVSPGMVGVLLAVTACGGIAGALLSTRLTRRFGTARGLLLSDLGTAPFVLLLPLTGHGVGLLWFVLGGFVSEMGMVAGNVIFGSFRQAYCPPALLGRVTACTRFAVFGTIPLGALLGGILGTGLGIREAVWIATTAHACSALILLAGDLRCRRDFPESPAHAPARLRGV